MSEVSEGIKKGVSVNDDKSFTKLTIKEILDKIGFGFGSQQFINILFLQIGAPLFLVGLINIFRVIFGNLISFFIEKFQSVKKNKKLIGLSGIIFGFSFLLIGIAIFLKSIALFVSAIIIGSITIVIYGESNTFFKISSDKAYLFEKIIKYSLIITAISLFIAAYLMDKYPISGVPILFNFFNNLVGFKIYGYLIVFEIAAISFIFAGYVLSKVKGKTIISTNFKLKEFFAYGVKNKVIVLLIVTSLIVSLVQTIGYSYYGIFIYQKLNDVMFGGFLNVAMVFLVSVFSSLIGYFITKINSKVYRKFPILIFGIAMVAFMPFAYFLKADLMFITIGTIIGVIGSSTVGITNSFLAIELININLRQAYFSFINLASIPFFLIMAPIFVYFIKIFNLSELFLFLTIILVVLIIMLLILSVMFKKDLP